MKRRDFLKSTLATTIIGSGTLLQSAETAPVVAAAAKSRKALQKGFMLSTLKGDTAQKLTLTEKFALLRDAGFHGVEVMSAMNQDEVLAARAASGLKIPSVIVATHWAKPLSDPNPETRKIGFDGLVQALLDAKAYGASSVLLVPAVVTKEVSYADAFKRSQDAIRNVLPLADSLGVVIAVENVWNRFLLSPLEARDYVDSFKSPWVQWHFDVGNVVNFGWPEQWVDVLGRRIVKIHVKEYSRKRRDEKGPFAGFEVDLSDGDSDWPSVMAALDKVSYGGWMITEQYRPPGFDDAAWLVHLSKKLDQIFAC